MAAITATVIRFNHDTTVKAISPPDGKPIKVDPPFQVKANATYRVTFTKDGERVEFEELPQTFKM